MDWNELYGADCVPTNADIQDFVGEAVPNWNRLVTYLEETYKTRPQIDYSKCSAQPGWNVKYKKGSKSLCTLYPMSNYFIALVVVGAKEEEEVEVAMAAGMFSQYVKELYGRTIAYPMGRWLMIEVRGSEVIDDIMNLIRIRASSR